MHHKPAGEKILFRSWRLSFDSWFMRLFTVAADGSSATEALELPEVGLSAYSPDIEVDNLPEQVIAGRDPQLEKALEVIMQKLAEKPTRLPEKPEPPGKK